VIGTSIAAVTDSAGAFLLEGLPGGHTVIDIFHDGRTGPPVYLELGTRERRWVELEVTRTVVPVREIRVRIAGSPSRLTGFRRRRAAGIGEFIGEDEIRRRSPAVLSQLLRSSVGLDVGRDLPGGPRIASRRGECRLTYFLDGMRAEGLNIDALRPRDVVGLEIYHGGSRVPPQFVRRGSCGAVVIWTRDP
jgi:hypothetical protein